MENSNKKLSKKRVFEYIFAFALLAFIIFVVILNFANFKSEQVHISWHKEHQVSVQPHNNSIDAVVSSVAADAEAN